MLIFKIEWKVFELSNCAVGFELYKIEELLVDQNSKVALSLSL